MRRVARRCSRTGVLVGVSDCVAPAALFRGGSRIAQGASYRQGVRLGSAWAGHPAALGGQQRLLRWRMDSWAPVVIDAHAETDWPETLVLDSTDFWWTNARTQTRRREFAILTALPTATPVPGRRTGARGCGASTHPGQPRPRTGCAC